MSDTGPTPMPDDPRARGLARAFDPEAFDDPVRAGWARRNRAIANALTALAWFDAQPAYVVGGRLEVGFVGQAPLVVVVQAQPRTSRRRRGDEH